MEKEKALKREQIIKIIKHMYKLFMGMIVAVNITNLISFLLNGSTGIYTTVLAIVGMTLTSYFWFLWLMRRGDKNVRRR